MTGQITSLTFHLYATVIGNMTSQLLTSNLEWLKARLLQEASNIGLAIRLKSNLRKLQSVGNLTVLHAHCMIPY